MPYYCNVLSVVKACESCLDILECTLIGICLGPLVIFLINTMHNIHFYSEIQNLSKKAYLIFWFPQKLLCCCSYVTVIALFFLHAWTLVRATSSRQNLFSGIFSHIRKHVMRLPLYLNGIQTQRERWRCGFLYLISIFLNVKYF